MCTTRLDPVTSKTLLHPAFCLTIKKKRNKEQIYRRTNVNDMPDIFRYTFGTLVFCRPKTKAYILFMQSYPSIWWIKL